MIHSYSAFKSVLMVKFLYKKPPASKLKRSQFEPNYKAQRWAPLIKKLASFTVKQKINFDNRYCQMQRK